MILCHKWLNMQPRLDSSPDLYPRPIYEAVRQTERKEQVGLLFLDRWENKTYQEV